MIKIFIGYDQKESSAYHVLAHSIISRSSLPVSITPVKLSNLSRYYYRASDPMASTEFSLSRFLVPSLLGFAGWSIFMDCDMLCQGDIADLFALRNPEYAVQVVKHDYVPKQDIKMLGSKQTTYAKKNWSSMMMFNNSRCRALTGDYVNHASGLELHQFKWLENDSLIGSLPSNWNYLVGEYPLTPHVDLIHYTNGGPWWKKYEHCDYSALWFSELESMLCEKGKDETSQRLLSTSNR